VSSVQRKPVGLAEVVPIGARRGAAPRFADVDDETLVAGLRAGDRAAMDTLVDRYGAYVERVLARIVGFDSELPDLVHDVFITALDSIEGLRDPTLLKPWLRGVTVFVARGCLRRRRRRRWLTFRPDHELPDLASDVLPSNTTDALARLYKVLGRMPPDECIVFALRFIAELELAEVAEACRVSRTTVKRRLQQAERRFAAEAARDPLLLEWMNRGDRWSQP
jgi:RNA polymerase sigma-70 factor (ECF subfamily)